MIRNIRKTHFGIEGEMDCKLFNQQIGVMADEEVNEEYISKCADYLNNLPEELIDHLCDASIEYCKEFCEDVGEGIPEINSKRDILKYIQPRSLIIEAPIGEQIVFHMELDCDWEIEHGLEWTINNGRVLYVGSFESEGGWREEEYYKQLSWNYAFK